MGPNGQKKSVHAEEVSVHALRTLHQQKKNKVKATTLADDVVKLQKYLKEMGQQQVLILQKPESSKEEILEAWSKLNKVVLTSLICFNRRRQGETSKMTLADYQEKQTVGRIDGVVQFLSKVEQELCKVITRVELVGKKGKIDPLLFTSEHKHCLRKRTGNQMVVN